MSKYDPKNIAGEWMQENVRVRVFDSVYAGETPEKINESQNALTRACWKCADAVKAREINAKNFGDSVPKPICTNLNI